MIKNKSYVNSYFFIPYLSFGKWYNMFIKKQNKRGKIMKKILLTLGSIGAISAPVASVVSCGNDKTETGGVIQVSKPATVGATTVSSNIALPDGATVSATGIVQAIKDRDNEITQKIQRASAYVSQGSIQGLQTYINEIYKIGVVTTTYNISYKGGAATHFTSTLDLSKSIDVASFNAMKLSANMDRNLMVQKMTKWMQGAARYQLDNYKDFFKKLRNDGSFNAFRAAIPSGVNVELIGRIDATHGPLLANATDAQIDTFFDDYENYLFGPVDPLLSYEGNH